MPLRLGEELEPQADLQVQRQVQVQVQVPSSVQVMRRSEGKGLSVLIFIKQIILIITYIADSPSLP